MAVRANSARRMRTQADANTPGSSIGASYKTWLEAEGLIERGLPFCAIDRLAEASGMSYERIKKLARLTAATFARRRQAGKLSPEESERILRISRVFERAMDLFHADRGAARQWLDTPLPALGGRAPMDLSRSEVGAREVEDLIGRIQHGVIS